MDTAKVFTVLACLLARVNSESYAKRIISRIYRTSNYGDHILPPYQDIPSPNSTISPLAYTYAIPSPSPTKSSPPYTYSNTPADTHIYPTSNPTIDPPLYTYSNTPAEIFITPTPKSTISPPLYTYPNSPVETFITLTPKPIINPPLYVFPHPPENTYIVPTSRPSTNLPTNTYLEPVPKPSLNYLPPFINPSTGRFPTQTPGYVEGDDCYAPPNYQFRHMVQAPEYGTKFGHEETRQGGVTQGKYYVLLPDGRTQVVSYVADQEGYRSQIDYQDGAGV